MLDLKDIRLHVRILSTPFHLYQINVSTKVPEQLQYPSPTPSFHSITTTLHETSIVTTAKLSPERADGGKDVDDGIKYDGPWSCLMINGPMDVTLKGIMSAFSKVLAEAGVAIFAISTYNTDYVLVHEPNLAQAADALRQAGWVVADE